MWSRWRFSQSLKPPERLSYLTESIDFDDIVRLIVAQSRSRVTFVKIERSKGRQLKGGCRPHFQLEVEPKTLDLFYNSPWGYRGQYCIDVENGLCRNRQVLRALMESLLASIEGRGVLVGRAVDVARQSLQLPSAKVWIREKDQLNTSDYTLVEEVLHAEWLANARNARADLDAHRVPAGEKMNAIIGVRAAYGSFLDVKGAWITDSGIELIDEYKRSRSEHIRDYGFS